MSRVDGRVVVLVVEDEPLIRLNAVAMIEDAGFEVLEAANADEAILILENRSDIRIVFTTFTCQALWMAFAWRMRSGIDGPRSSSS